ncbi:MAG TPA: carbohydrate kinase [Phycisphaerales bacterium]|nr:carbohydrate kinase [Phycisphaerales bacterium]
MPSVICLGELLIDFYAAEADVSLAEARTFVKAPGGAPANVAVAVARLGESCGFIGAVGNDPFGEFLRDTVAQAGVDVSRLAKIDDVRTTLAFIAARSDGRKDITFYRNPGADMRLDVAHLDAEYLAQAEAFHYGSISRIDAGPRAATDRARRLTAEGGAMLSYDPNWRPSLWRDADAARDRILEGFDGAHVAKVSLEEWEFVTERADFSAGAGVLLDRGVQLVVRSEGPDGASFATARRSGHVDAFAVRCVEPTGAGDGAMACLIVELLAHWRRGVKPGELDAPELTRIVRRANAVGALACTRVGAIPSLPAAREVDEFLRKQ